MKYRLQALDAALIAAVTSTGLLFNAFFKFIINVCITILLFGTHDWLALICSLHLMNLSKHPNKEIRCIAKSEMQYKLLEIDW